MLVISKSLVLTSPDQFSVNNPVIGYQNILTTSIIASSSADASGFYPITNVVNPATYTKWKAADNTSQTITITPPNVNTEYIGIARHNLGTQKISVKVEGATVAPGGVPTYFTLIDEQLFPNDSPLLLRFTRANYLSLRITLGSGLAAAQIAVIYCGTLLTLQRRIYVGHVPITMGRKTVTTNGMSENGQFLGRLFVSEGRTSAISMKNVTPDWYRQYFDPFVEAAGEIPWFFAWRPQDYPLEVGYCWFPSDAKPTNQSANGLMSCDIAVNGIS